MYKLERTRKCDLSFSMHIITFLGIKEQAHSLGVPDFELKIFRSQINNGKGKNYLIQTQAQLDLERASLIGSCGELNSEFLQNAGRFSPVFFCPGLFHLNLGGRSFRTWWVGHFGQFSE